MKLKTKIEWAKLARPDKKDNKYSVTIRPTKEEQEVLEEYLYGVWRDKMGTKKEPAWLGGKGELKDGTIRFTASRKATRKINDIEVPDPVKVFNKAAVEFKTADIPNVANGATVVLSLRASVTEYGSKKGVTLFLQSVQLVQYEVYSSDEGFEPIEDEDDEPGAEETAEPTISASQRKELWTAAKSPINKEGLGCPLPRWDADSYEAKLKALGFESSANVPIAALKGLVDFFENTAKE